MGNGKCSCGDKKEEICKLCGAGGVPLYWCDHCGEAVEEKRCPRCGLKAKKVGKKSFVAP